MFNGHSNMHGSYVWGRGGGGVSDFCVTYHLTQTMDSEVFPLLWDMIGTVAWVICLGEGGGGRGVSDFCVT